MFGFNLKNVIENLVLILISVTVGVGIGAFVAIKVTDMVLDNQNQIIEAAINKNTTEIKNEFKNEFKKIKSKKSQPINIVIDPTTNSVISSKDSTQVITVEKKKGFFKRLFTKNNKDVKE